MSILVDRRTRVLTQGITGEYGKRHTLACREYGTQIVGGVTPGRGGTDVEGIPVFNTVSEAVRATGANTTMIFVPAPFAADAVAEAAAAGLQLIVCITEGIPALDEVRMKQIVTRSGARLVGPNCPGLISPGERAKVGIMPGFIHRPGRVGVVSRSGTLTYEAVWQLSRLGLGQSTCIGIGGDPVVGTTHVDALRLLEEDDETEAILLIGEIGGTAEEEAAAFVRDHVTKPVVGFVAGRTAPAGKRMGHAGAIIAGGKGTAAEKIAAFEAAGIVVADSPALLGSTLVGLLAAKKARRQRGVKSRAKQAPAGKRSATAKRAAKKGTSKKHLLQERTSKANSAKRSAAKKRAGRGATREADRVARTSQREAPTPAKRKAERKAKRPAKRRSSSAPKQKTLRKTTTGRATGKQQTGKQQLRKAQGTRRRK